MNAYGQTILQLLPADSLQLFTQAHQKFQHEERKGFLVFLVL